MAYRTADPPDRADPIAREVQRLRRIRWLDPDPDLAELGTDARAWLDATAMEHVRLLTPHLETGTTTHARVVVTRGFEETCAHFEDLEHFWLDLFLEVLTDLVETVSATGVLRIEVEQAIRESQDRSQPWVRTLGPHWTAPRPGVATALAHVGWIARHGERASPWSALLSCWERGLWPLPLLDGGLLVYVPHVRDRALVANPGHPDAAPRIERKTVYFERDDLEWPTDPFELPIHDPPAFRPEDAGFGPLPRIVQVEAVEWPPRNTAPRIAAESWCRQLLRRLLGRRGRRD